MGHHVSLAFLPWVCVGDEICTVQCGFEGTSRSKTISLDSGSLGLHDSWYFLPAFFLVCFGLRGFFRFLFDIFLPIFIDFLLLVMVILCGERNVTLLIIHSRDRDHRMEG
jgi:hypothetical protein